MNLTNTFSWTGESVGRRSENHVSMRRRVVISGTVVLLHAVGLWAVQNGLQQQALPIHVPVEVMAEVIEAPAAPLKPVPASPPATPPPLSAQTVPAELNSPVSDMPLPLPLPLPQPQAQPQPRPQSQQEAVAESPVQTPLTTPLTTPAPRKTTPVKVELPSSSADYLDNPAPKYPAMSRRLGEHGRVLVRVLVGIDGKPQKAELKQSSGFDRLDQTALDTIMTWRFVPGQRAGVKEAMWAVVPLQFILE